MKTQGKVWIIYDTEQKTQTNPMSIVQAQVILLSIPIQDHGKFLLWTPGWDRWVSLQDFLASDQKYFVLHQPPKPNIPDPQPSHEYTLTATHTNVTNASNNAYTQVLVGDSPIKNEQEDSFYMPDFNGDQLDLKKIAQLKSPSIKKSKSSSAKQNAPQDNDSDRRREPRHNFKIEVVLVSKIRSFRTYSINISLSGTLLDHEIPKDFLNNSFDLIITNPFEPDSTKARLLFRAKIVGDLTDPRRLMFIEKDPMMTSSLEALLKAYIAYQNQKLKNAG